MQTVETRSAKRYAWLALASLLLLPFAALVVGILSIPRNADLPLEGCIHGCTAWLWGALVPFSFGLATLSFYKKAAVVYRQEPEAVLPPPRWISTVGNLICILAGLPLIPLVFVILLKVVEITLRKAGIPP